MEKVSAEERFLFDLQGFLLLKNVYSAEECRALLDALRRLEAQDYDDRWIMERGSKQSMPTRFRLSKESVRMNGLLRLDPAFDVVMDQPRVLARLQAFMGEPQLINTWSISKGPGTPEGGWHRGIPPTDYSVRNGEIRSRMLNVVTFLTDNGPKDGCVVAVPGSHKNNLDLPWGDYHGLGMPGSVAVTGKAGDVFMFSEAVVHNGLPKTTPGTRSNLYFNYVHKHMNVAAFEPHNLQHFFVPPEVRARFTPERKKLTEWMEHCRWD
ncbi:MAG: phytanoyl-CoA dioxygenase family protein [Planctomycetes bacterium]|nr:phytanoyl-CoA dioxygenase family protein [Planctomycetota bacterium]